MNPKYRIIRLAVNGSHNKRFDGIIFQLSQALALHRYAAMWVAIPEHCTLETEMNDEC